MMFQLALAGSFILMASAGGSATEPAQAPPFEEMLKIDVHVHFFDDIPELAEMMKRNNIRVVNICLYGTKPELLEPGELRAEYLQATYPPHFYFASTFDLTRRAEPDYAGTVTAWLDRTFQGGALMVKLWKEVGMQITNADGAFIMPDDPIFDPVYSHIAKRNKVLMMHVADPIDAWRPLNPNSLHYAYYRDNPEWYVYNREGFPSHEAIMTARDNVLAKHPDLAVVGAHFGSMTHDLAAVAERMDRYPNFHVDVSARTPALHGKPLEEVREFFIKYQDRVLYGTDASKFTPMGQPTEEERIAFAQSMEKAYRSDYRYYAGSGKATFGGREIECLNLPREVLEKFYYKNAQRLMPGLAAE